MYVTHLPNEKCRAGDQEHGMGRRTGTTISRVEKHKELEVLHMDTRADVALPRRIRLRPQG